MATEKERLAEAYGDNEHQEGRIEIARAPPSYELSSNASAQWRASRAIVPVAYSHLNLSAYHMPNAQLSPDKSTLTIYSTSLCSEPAALERFISEQIALPPRPTVRIRANMPNQPLPLFDINFDLLRHISPDGARHANWAYTKVHGMDDTQEPVKLDEKHALFSGQPDPTGAGFWLRRFCVSNSSPKRFVFKREILHWDTKYLDESIREFIKSTGYRGPPVFISFPIQYQTIIIQTPHKVNALVTGLQNLFVTPKTYEPLTAVWPYASIARSGPGGHDTEQRQVVLQDEDDWLVEWREVIQVAIANRRCGWMGDADKVDAVIEGPAIAAKMKKKIQL